MLQFSYKLKVAERLKAKSERHPRYNPERDGRDGTKGALLDLLRPLRPASGTDHANSANRRRMNEPTQ